MANEIENFLPDQYDQTDRCDISHNYLKEQFSDYQKILDKVGEVVQKGDFTLGRAVDAFEARFAKQAGAKFAVGVGSGTDALFLSLKAIGVGPGDEVITTPFTFYATIGAIVTAGAKPVFVDARNDYNIDPELIEIAITKNTKAILPVHWSGKPCDMDPIQQIAKDNELHIVEDACHAITAQYKGRPAGTYGTAGCFSMHPLKNLNVWGDGGVICTNDEDFANKIRLLRNHGLRDRDHCDVFAYNSRLDTVQAVVADHLLDKLPDITDKRISNALYLDKHLTGIDGVMIPPREADHIRQVYHIYSLRFARRDELQAYLESRGIDAKVHYPIPMHLQPAAKEYGYKAGDFPMAEAICNSTLSLPVHEFITNDQLDQMIAAIKEFYS
ncbi:MAG: DegT/DnrJ/EryC1/StrS family aminotransferase [Methyloligellaceae bacterium]